MPGGRIVRKVPFGCVALVLLSLASPVLAQAPAAPPCVPPPEPPPPALTGSVSFGLGVTAGNKDTTNLNAGYELNYDPKTKNVVKSSGIFLYGKTDGTLSNETYGLSGRDEYSISARAFVFGDVRYLHDRFKGIQSMFSPNGGVGYKLVDSKATSLSVSGGLGAVWEKDYGFDTRTTGAVTFDEKVTQKLSASASVGQSFSALWNISDFGDALYLFRANLTAAVVGKAQLKLELLDTYKTRPQDPTLKSNDVNFITGIVFKF
jgi:putative salt-induced outer membrane protein